MHIVRFMIIAASAVIATAAHADYPDRPVKVVVPYSPGGPADLLGRYVAQRLSASLGQPFVVENKPGAGLVIGAEYVAKSVPDGYTLFVAASSMLIDSGSRMRTPADNLKDFAPISLVGSFPLVLVASPSLPVNNVRETIEYVKRRPNDVYYGSSGNGSLTHLAGELFGQMTGLKMVHVPYRGINEALTDMLANRVQFAFAGAPIALPQAKSGKVRALAVTSAARTSSAPELPTIAEDGLPGYDVTPWYGMVAPAATPRGRDRQAPSRDREDHAKRRRQRALDDMGRRPDIQQVAAGFRRLDARRSGQVGEARGRRQNQARITEEAR